MASVYYIVFFLSLLSHNVVRSLSLASAGGSQGSSCTPFRTTFPSSDISRSENTPFIAISPKGSYGVTDGGLELYLDRPHGAIKTENGANDKVGEGSTVNSTFTLLYGKVSFEVQAPSVRGVVTAAILIADGGDEVDVEMLGGDPSRWQSNVFSSTPNDNKPLWGAFGEIEDFSPKSTITTTHTYTIDWNPDRIIWSVDGSTMRTLHKEETRKNGNYHFPSHPSRIQLGIWDASSPAGTAEWAKGPMNWQNAPPRIVATFRSVEVKYPYV